MIQNYFRRALARRNQITTLEAIVKALKERAAAREATIALEMATSRHEAKQKKETASVLLDLARSLAEADTTGEVCNSIALELPTICGASKAIVFTWSESDEILRARAWNGVSDTMAAALGGMEVGTNDTPAPRELLSRKGMEIHSLSSTSDPFIAGQLRLLEAEHVAVIPVHAGGRPAGAICAAVDASGFSVSQEALEERLSGVADQAERALERASVIQRQIERSERLRGQKEILEMVARGANLREILDELCTTVESQIDGARCGIQLMDGDGKTLQTVASPNLPGEFCWDLNGLKPGPFAGSAGTAVYREHGVFVEDIATDRLWEDQRESAAVHGFEAAWSMPIFAATSSRVLGAFSVYVDRKILPSGNQRAHMEMAVQLAAITIERKELEAQLTHQAFHDSLTSLPNRLLFADRVQHAIDRAARQDESIAVLLVDLDDFKSVNDSLGHLAGDEMLRMVAAKLSGCLRAADTAARLGGDEFAILLEGTDKSSAMNIAERILESLDEPMLLFGREMRISGSIGIAFSLDGKGQVSDLLRNADTAMYAAKEGGRSRYEIFEQRMHSGILKRLELQTELKKAVDNGDIVVHYQPVYRLDPHEMVGVEALVRWEHAERGLIPPLEFIPMAEETGLIVPIGAQVLESTCAQLKTWSASLDRARPLEGGVNFSARQLQTPTLVEEIASCLSRHDLDPAILLLEITESVLMHDPEETARKLEELRELGVGIAIDDFGTGYSSLSYLRRFPVNVLKIDRYFVQGMDRSPEDAAYGHAIVRLGHNLNLAVIAEGIETAGEYEALLEMGCDYGQGFLFAKPCPADELILLPGISGRSPVPDSTSP